MTIRELSGEIWDIDGLDSIAFGTEQWVVDVLTESGDVLTSTTSPLGTEGGLTAPLDGRPWTFGFTELPDGVDKVRISFVGLKTTGIGLAFNNFQPVTSATSNIVPEPAGVAIWSILGIALILPAVRTVLRGSDRPEPGGCRT